MCKGRLSQRPTAPLDRELVSGVVASQILIVPSALPLARHRPRGQRRRFRSGQCALESQRFLARDSIPDLDGLVIAGAGQTVAVGTKGEPPFLVT